MELLRFFCEPFAAGLVLAAACLAGCARSETPSNVVVTVAPSSPHHFPVQIRPALLPRPILADQVDARGEPVTLQCVGCHGVRSANLATAKTADLDEFHQGLKVAHGNLTCGSCHQAADGYSTLKLADNRSLLFEESMVLCAQCHGTQFRDYQHGAHGGMAGHWDLSRGGRTRNHCLNCHDPHAPQYPVFTPAPGPRDRFPPKQAGEGHE